VALVGCFSSFLLWLLLPVFVFLLVLLVLFVVLIYFAVFKKYST
jgi:4-hydroxybenzoate polyprenyltransferase